MPTISRTAAADFIASANEPPIRPTPTTTSFPTCTADALNRACRIASVANGALERLQETRVLVRQSDGHAQVCRETIVGHRTHDHSLLQQPLIHARTVADADQQEIRMRRRVTD